MSFDFGKLSAGNAIASIVEPATLFDALPNKAEGYGYLRAVQKTVLDAWSGRRDERDIVVKTNTGGGKTIVGLLILQVCLNEKKGPAVYIAPESDLARRVQEEADNLGILTVDDPTSTKFLRGEAICVTTMKTLVNGKTRFGLRVPGSRPPVSVQSILIDDAHAALALTEEKTRLHIPAGHQAYGELLALFAEDLKSQGLNAFKDIEAGDRSAVQRVPFWAWHDKQENVANILHPYRLGSDFEWSWPLVSDLLPVCQAVVTAENFEIMPPCPPIEKIPSFAEAQRRIYLTATLADDSVLVTHFDADPSSIATSIVPESAADLGDRLILSPQELYPDISDDEIRELAGNVAEHDNVVVLVPSKAQARRWNDYADSIVSTTAEISTAISELTAGHVGLVVIVNRYDGIDLPDEACRLLIIDSLPFAYNGIERREAIALRDSQAMVTRQLQRLEQGMGRGVRSRDDRCVVLILGSRLTQLLARMDIADRLSAATYAQLELSRTVAGGLEGTEPAMLEQVIKQVIESDRGFRKLSREALVGVTYSPASVSPTAVALRSAYNSAVGRRQTEAAQHAKAAVDAARAGGDNPLAGWLSETYAAYLHPVNPVAAQQVLSDAGRHNNAVLHPIKGLEYQRISQTSPQANQASDWLSRTYANGDDLIVGLDAVLTDIAWDGERTDSAEAALADLGQHLGFTAQRPEMIYGLGCDVLWALGGHTYVVIEAKTGAEAPLIWKKDINQLGGSVNWCRSEYGADAKIIPVIVHPSNMIERTGTPPDGARVINSKKLKHLRNSVRSFARAVAQENRYRSPGAVEEQLRYAKLTAETLALDFTEATYREAPKTS
ncbi:helicase C-terminal domain-containing protein [Micromonospora chalcea]